MIHRDRGVVVSQGLRLRTEPLEETVYRYRAINDRLERILVHDELFFATPRACNDPFDCRFEATMSGELQGLEKMLEEQAIVAQMSAMAGMPFPGPLPGRVPPKPELATMTEEERHAYARQLYGDLLLGEPVHQEHVKRTIESVRERIGICCFAGRGDNLLMFSHYADQHRGCCLEFLTRDEDGRRQIFEDEGLLRGEVMYSDEAVTVSLYEMGTIDSITRVLFTKHSRWSYEEEVRVLRLRGPGPVRYRRAALSGVIFGYDTPAADVTRVREWLGPRPNVRLSKAVLNRSLGLELVPL